VTKNTKSKTKTTLTFRHKPSGKFLHLEHHAALLVDYKDWRIPSFGIHQRDQMRFILKGYADRGELPPGTTESEYEIVREKITTVVIREVATPTNGTSKTPKKKTKR
jgi:hypothetical protein